MADDLQQTPEGYPYYPPRKPGTAPGASPWAVEDVKPLGTPGTATTPEGYEYYPPAPAGEATGPAPVEGWTVQSQVPTEWAVQSQTPIEAPTPTQSDERPQIARAGMAGLPTDQEWQEIGTKLMDPKLSDWAVKAVEPIGRSLGVGSITGLKQNFGFPGQETGDFPQLRREAQDQLAKGAKQITSGEKTYGAGNLIAGGFNYLTSPVNAAIRSSIARPFEQAGGPSKEYTEFAATLALPVIGMGQLNQTKEAAKVIGQILNPGASVVGQRAVGTIRQQSGMAARDTARSQYKLEKYAAPLSQRLGNAGSALMSGKPGQAVDALFDNYARRVNQLSPQQQLDMLHYMETRTSVQQPRGAGGKMTSRISPELKPIADEFKKAMQQRVAKIRATEWGKDIEFLKEDYVTHYWQDPAKAQQFMNAWVLKNKQGNAYSLRKREIPTIAEGIAAGLVPKSTNPIDIAVQYVTNMDKYIAANNVIEAGRKVGDVKYFPRGARNVPDGWMRLTGRLAEKETPAGMMYAHAPEDWAMVYNNFISKGIHQSAPWGRAYDAYMRASNSVTAMVLGVAGYHAFTMSKEAIISGFSNGMAQMFTGLKHLEPRTVLHGVATAAEAIAKPFTSAVRGKKVQNAYLSGPNVPPQVRQIANILTEVGGRAASSSKHAQDYQFSQAGSFWNSWRRGALKAELAADWQNIKGQKVVGSASVLTKNIGRALSTISGPLFEHYIPLMKNGAFSDAMSTWLKANPLASKEEQLKAGRMIWDSIDNRLGETVNANIFWNQGLKQAAQAGMLSYSWNLGTIREIGGGARDLVKHPLTALDLKSPNYSSRAAYVVAFPIVVGMTNSIYQYLKTGTVPQNTRDFMAPQTGGMVPPLGGEFEPRLKKDGTPYKSDENRRATGKIPQRALLPGYEKDVYGWYHHPMQEASNKMSPALKLITNTFTNTDWKGDPIWNKNAPPSEALKQYMMFVMQSFVPISLKQANEPGKPGNAINPMEKGMGVREMSPYLQDPEGYHGYEKYRSEHAWDEKLRHENPEKYDLKRLEAETRREKNRQILEKKGEVEPGATPKRGRPRKTLEGAGTGGLGTP